MRRFWLRAEVGRAADVGDAAVAFFDEVFDGGECAFVVVYVDA
ncbi:hypothetical protein ACQ86N_29275 [Puia sp. P3]